MPNAFRVLVIDDRQALAVLERGHPTHRPPAKHFCFPATGGGESGNLPDITYDQALRPNEIVEPVVCSGAVLISDSPASRKPAGRVSRIRFQG